MKTPLPLSIMCTVILWGSTGYTADPTPVEILEQAKTAYAGLTSYQSEGTITADVETQAVKINTVTQFKIQVKKPNQYLVTWSQKSSPLQAQPQVGAVWSDGTQPYFFMGALKAYSKMDQDIMALSAATGISGGAAHTIPSLLLEAFMGQPTVLDRLQEPRLTGKVNVDGEECWVLTGPSMVSSKEVLWISTKDHLLRKYERSLTPPAQDTVPPEISDEQLKKAMESLGQEMTEDSVEKMRAMMKRSRDMLAQAKLQGVSTEQHTGLGSPELSAEDFKFEVPDGVVFKADLLGGVLKNMRGLPGGK